MKGPAEASRDSITLIQIVLCLEFPWFKNRRVNKDTTFTCKFDNSLILVGLIKLIRLVKLIRLIMLIRLIKLIGLIGLIRLIRLIRFNDVLHLNINKMTIFNI